MKKLNILINILLFMALMAVSAVPSHADEDPVTKARDAVLGYFVPVSGMVEGIDGDTARVRLEGEVNLPARARLNVFKEGEPFYHPVTKEKIGNIELLVGRIEIQKKEAEGLYIAGLKSGKVETGDRVRLVSSKIKLAFFQERQSNWALSEVFYNSLKESGRFEILESYTPTYEPKELAKLARDIGAEALLLFSTPRSNEKKAINVKLFWAGDAAMFSEIEEMIARDVDVSVPDDEFLSVDLVEREPWSTYHIKKGRMMAMGDINNNGEVEIVVSDGNTIRIYSRKKDLREEWLIEGNPSDKHLSIDVLDFNNNGYAEIFVTSMINEREMRSFVLEYNSSGTIDKIKDNIPYFMRVSGSRLMMQGYGYINKFMGPVYQGVFEDGEYRTGKPLNLPAALNIYGFTYVDWQESGNFHLLTFDDTGVLHLYDDTGNSIWRSEESYGAPDISVRKSNTISADSSGEWFIRGRLVAIKTDRGHEVMVLRKIPELKIIPGIGYKAVDVYSLWWDGATMDMNPVLKGLPGKVNDFRTTGERLFLLAKADMISFVTNMVGGKFSRGSKIYFYNIKGK